MASSGSLLTSLRTRHERRIFQAAAIVVALAFVEGLAVPGSRIGPAFASLLGAPIGLVAGLVTFGVQLFTKVLAPRTLAAFMTGFFGFFSLGAVASVLLYPSSGHADDPAGNFTAVIAVGVAIAAHLVWKRARAAAVIEDLAAAAA